MKKIIFMYNNFVKKILTIILITNFFSVVSFAQCNFGLNIGDSYPQSFKDKYGELNIDESLNSYFEEADKICASNTFEDIQIKYTFVVGKLGSIEMIALNDDNNIPSNKLILMNYAKTNYGEFDTGTNPQSFNYYNIWRNNNSEVLYKRLLGFNNIWDESLYITNKEYRLLISSIRAFEEGMKEVVQDN